MILLALGLTLILFLVPLLFTILVLSGFISDFAGASFVPTSGKIVDEILAKAKLKKDQFFLELGCGDSRIVRTAVKKYRVKGMGVDINPLLILYSKFLSRIQKLPNIKFINQNIFKTDFSKADVIFIFLLPKLIRKIKNKFETECNVGTIIISHGFKIDGFEKYLFWKIERDLFPTYYYKISKK